MNGEPKRVSALNSLKKCSGLVSARTISPGESGQAADTGTMVGRGIELWHKGSTYEEILRSFGNEMESDYPKADAEQAKRIVLCYVDDPRNPPEIVVTDSLELEVTLRLDPDEDDPTGEPIVLSGHTDQVRYAFPGQPELGLRLWDVKNGRASGDDMTRDYAYQIAAYTIALQDHYGAGEVLPGGIIRTKGYLARGVKDPADASVFYETPWTLEQCHAILGTVRYLIGQIRAGVIPLTPGSHCRYCPLEYPNCTTGGLERLISQP